MMATRHLRNTALHMICSGFTDLGTVIVSLTSAVSNSIWLRLGLHRHKAEHSRTSVRPHLIIAYLRATSYRLTLFTDLRLHRHQPDIHCTASAVAQTCAYEPVCVVSLCIVLHRLSQIQS